MPRSDSEDSSGREDSSPAKPKSRSSLQREGTASPRAGDNDRRLSGTGSSSNSLSLATKQNSKRDIALLPSQKEKPKPPELEGYLLKLKRAPHLLISGWNKRWFVVDLESRQLRYYKNASASKPQGYIDLDEITAVVAFDDLQFQIESRQRNFFLKSESKAECTCWVKSLEHYRREMLEYVKFLTATPISSPSDAKNAEMLSSAPSSPSAEQPSTPSREEEKRKARAPQDKKSPKSGRPDSRSKGRRDYSSTDEDENRDGDEEKRRPDRRRSARKSRANEERDSQDDSSPRSHRSSGPRRRSPRESKADRGDRRSKGRRGSSESEEELTDRDTREKEREKRRDRRRSDRRESSDEEKDRRRGSSARKGRETNEAEADRERERRRDSEKTRHKDDVSLSTREKKKTTQARNDDVEEESLDLKDDQRPAVQRQSVREQEDERRFASSRSFAEKPQADSSERERDNRKRDTEGDAVGERTAKKVGTKPTESQLTTMDSVDSDASDTEKKTRGKATKTEASLPSPKIEKKLEFSDDEEEEEMPVRPREQPKAEKTASVEESQRAGSAPQGKQTEERGKEEERRGPHRATEAKAEMYENWDEEETAREEKRLPHAASSSTSSHGEKTSVGGSGTVNVGAAVAADRNFVTEDWDS